MEKEGNNIDKGGLDGDVSKNGENESTPSVDGSSSSKTSKSPLDKLSKDELLAKCRNLIIIAQKAKAAKDDAVVELKKAQEKSGEEQEALMEMVNSLTEGKVAMATKTESLQRQLNLTASELETLQSSQSQLLKSRQDAQERAENLEGKIERIKERFEKHILDEREKNNKLQENNKQLQEKFENLQVEASQINGLKVKCKKLLDEKNKLEDTCKQTSALLAEKKANEIVYEETRNLNKTLEANNKKLTNDIKVLEEKTKTMECDLEKQFNEIQSLKDQIQKMTECSNASNGNGETGTENEEMQKKYDSLNNELNAVREELENKTKMCNEYAVTIEQEKRNCSEEIEKINHKFETLSSQTGAERAGDLEKLKTYIELIKSLKTELTELKEDSDKQKNELLLKCSVLEQQLETSTTALKEKEADISDLQATVSSLQSEISKLNEHNSLMQKTHDELTSKVDETDSDTQKLKLEYESLKQEKALNCDTIEDLTNQLRAAQKKIEADLLQFKDKSEENNQNEIKIKELQNLVSILEIKLDEQEAKLQEVTQHNITIETEMQKLKIERDDFKNELQNANNFIESLSSSEKYPVLSKIVVSFVDEEAQSEYLKKMKDIFMSVEGKLSAFESIEREIDILKLQIQELRQQKMELESKLEDNKEAIELQNSIESLKVENAELQNDCTKNSELLKNIGCKLKESENTIETNASIISELTEKLSGLEEQNNNLQTEFHLKIEEREKLTETVNVELENLRAELKGKEAEVSELSKQLSTLQNNSMAVIGKEQELGKGLKEKIEILEAQVKKHEQTIQESQSSKTEIEHDRDNIKKNLTLIEEKYEKSCKDNDNLTVQVNNLNEQISSLTSNCNSDKTVLANTERLLTEERQKSQGFEENIEKLLNEIETLKENVIKFTEEKNIIVKELETIKKEKNELNTLLKETQNELESSKTNEITIQNALDEMSSDLSAEKALSCQLIKDKEETLQVLKGLQAENDDLHLRVNELKSSLKDFEEKSKLESLEDNEMLTELKKQKDELNEKLKATEYERDQFVQQISTCRNDNDELKTMLGKIKASNDNLNAELRELKTIRDSECTQMSALEQELGLLRVSVKELEANKEAVIAEKESLKSALEKLKIRETALVQEKEALQVTSERCLEELRLKSDECDQVDSERRALLLSNKEVNQRIEELQLEITQLTTVKEEINLKLQATEEQLSSTCTELELKERRLQEAEEKLTSTSSRCEELLSELNEVTGVLRERGERISRLEVSLKSSAQEFEKRIELLEQEKSSLKQELEHLIKNKADSEVSTSGTDQNMAANKVNDVKELQHKLAEMIEQKEQLEKNVQQLRSSKRLSIDHQADGVGGPTDGHSEVMSNSTISKVEETHRLKELEDTFEERYMKLKSVAIKLKKKLAEQTIQLNSAEEQNKKLQTEKEQLGSVKNVSKNIQVLQGEIDKLQDAVDVSKTQLKDRDSQLSAAANQLAATKDQLASALADVDSLKSSIKLLEEQFENEKKKGVELQSKVVTLQHQASGHEQQENKHLSLMTLKLQDSEQIIADLKEQLVMKESTASRDKIEVTSFRQKVSTLEAQLEQLSAKSAADESAANCLRTSNEELRSQLVEAEKELVALRLSKQQLSVDVERLMQQLECQKENVTDVSQSKSKLEEQLRNIRALSTQQVNSLEDKLETVTKELSDSNAELEDVKKEFEEYKTRAQNVLKQQQKMQKSPGIDINDMQQRLQHSETQLQTLQHTNRQLQSELSAVQSELKFLQSEKEQMVKQRKEEHNKHLLEMAQLQEQITQVQQKLHEETTRSQSVIAKMAAEGEAMATSYESQLKSREAAHEQEVTTLQVKLDALNRQMDAVRGTSAARASPSVEEMVAVDDRPGAGASKQRIDSVEDYNKVDVTTMIREQGEGSEWVESVPSHKRQGSSGARLTLTDPPYHPPPLQQLLLANTSADDSVSVASSAAADHQISHAYYSSQISALQSKVDSFEVRLQQVSSLLHESEAENAKLTQLTQALKEEIRRGNRNSDREKHLENLEYLKNVVLQFLTLGPGQEGRERLLPVLTTLLQLSPQEVHKIKVAATGDTSDGSAAGYGWGSYLHMWSGR